MVHDTHTRRRRLDECNLQQQQAAVSHYTTTTCQFYVSSCTLALEMIELQNCVCSILGGTSFGLDRNLPSVRIEIFQEKDIPDSCDPVSGIFEVSNGAPRPFVVSRQTGVLSAPFNSIHLKNFRRPSERNKNDELVTEIKYAFIFYTTVTMFDSAVNLRVRINSVCHHGCYISHNLQSWHCSFSVVDMC